MLAVQNEYWKNIETARHNRAMEMQNSLELIENRRHSMVLEEETKRANRRGEQLRESELLNAINRTEIERENAATNARNALTNAQNAMSNIRRNEIDYELGLGNLYTQSQKVYYDYLLGSEANDIRYELGSEQNAISNRQGLFDYALRTNQNTYAQMNAEANQMNAETNRMNAGTQKVGVFANTGSSVFGAILNVVGKAFLK